VLRYASDGAGADKNSRRSPGTERAKPPGVPSSGDPTTDEMYQTVLVHKEQVEQIEELTQEIQLMVVEIKKRINPLEDKKSNNEVFYTGEIV